MCSRASCPSENLEIIQLGQCGRRARKHTCTSEFSHLWKWEPGYLTINSHLSLVEGCAWKEIILWPFRSALQASWADFHYLGIVLRQNIGNADNYKSAYMQEHKGPKDMYKILIVSAVPIHYIFYYISTPISERCRHPLFSCSLCDFIPYRH